jgi:hypothetical protein
MSDRMGIGTAVTGHQYAWLRGHASEHGMNLSEYIRARLFDGLDANVMYSEDEWLRIQRDVLTRVGDDKELTGLERLRRKELLALATKWGIRYD